MKKQFAASVAVFATALSPLASAATYVYTFDDVSLISNQAKDTFNISRYWEYAGPDRWGTVWASPFTFTSTYPSSTNYNHFHIGFKGLADCYDFNTGGMGKFQGSTCVPLNPSVNRGPFSTHAWDSALFFQVIKQDGTAVPFVAKKIDVHNSADQAIDVFVRKTDGGWFYWSNLHGHGTSEANYYRWTLTSGYAGKFTAMAWKTTSGGGYPAVVGRVEITD